VERLADESRGTLLDHQGPGGGSPDLRHQLQVLKEFVHGFALEKMKPDNSVIRTGLPANGRAWALVEPGRAYAVCLVGRGTAELSVELPAGAFRAEWINTLDGSVAKKERFRHDGGIRRLQSPNFDQDIALSIKAE
jgi:hypothetical protein